MQLTNLGNLAIVALTMLTSACQSAIVASEPLRLSCPESLDQLCGQDLSCVRHIDPSNIAVSYCEQVGTAVSFGIFKCPPGMIDIKTDSVTGQRTGYLYDQKTGDLTLVIDWSDPDSGGPHCLAGPPKLGLTVDPPCIGASIGYGCAGPDSGLE